MRRSRRCAAASWRGRWWCLAEALAKSGGVPSVATLGAHAPDSPYAWLRLATILALMTVGSCAMYVVSVALPAVQAEFGVARSAASLPYTLLMLGFGFGGVVMGRLADKRGVRLVLTIGAFGLGLGFVGAGLSGGIWSFALIHGLLLGALGSSCSFAPLVADASLWFVRRRGIAVAIAAAGNYVAGAIWPPIVQHFVEVNGWRQTYIGMGVFCFAVMLLLAQAMRAKPPALDQPTAATLAGAVPSDRPFGTRLDRPFGLSMGQAWPTQQLTQVAYRP